MSRKGPATRREMIPDPVYRSLLITQVVNKVMLHGKKSTAESIVYEAMKAIEIKTGSEPLSTVKRAIDNVKPPLEVRSRRVGGATYQVPMEVRTDRGVALALRWLVQYSRGRAGRSMVTKLANELMDAANETGQTIRKREETHRMAEANKAFAHYRY